MFRRFTLRNTLACVALALLGTLHATLAGAVVFNSRFDPVDFFGDATFDVADVCLESAGFVANNGDPCSVTWLTADVTLTNGPNSVSFSYQPAHLPDPGAVSNIFVLDGELAGVNSSPIGPVVVVSSGDPELDGPWWIQFTFTQEFFADVVALNGAFDLGNVLLFHGTCELVDLTQICTQDTTPTAVAQVLSFTRVPEPGTLVLLAGTVFALLLVTRRREAR